MTEQLIISGKSLLVMDREQTIIEQGGVLIEGTTIRETGPRAELARRYPGARHLHEPHGVVLPGLVNTHTHAAMSCFRGLADDLPLMQWLQEHIFPREARLTGEIVYLSTLLSLCEMIRSGTTSFCDMYLFAADVARAVETSGVRAWLGEVLYDFPSPAYGELENGFSVQEQLFADFKEHELITITVNPHAVYTCAPELLVRLGEVAAAHGALYHIHLSENRDEVDTCRQRYGVSPVRHLDRLGLLTDRVLAAHCVMIDEEEIQLLAERGVRVAHCQESNMKLASGTAPAARMLEAGVCLSLGTDGPASNNDLDMFGEMNTVAKAHKAARMDPTAMTADQTLWAATRGGARALDAHHRIGTLQPGYRADLIVLDFNRPHLTPVYNPVSHLVYAARAGDVVHSVINGKVIMQDRKLLTLDESGILSSAREIKDFILARN